MKKYFSRDYLPVYITFLIFTFLMVFRIRHSSYWYDEWIELFYSRAGLTDGSLYRNIINTFQPPLYNLLANIWLRIRYTPTWLRLLNVVFGLVSGVSLYQLMRRKTSVLYSCLSVLLLGVSYQWVYFTQEASEYALVVMGIFLTLNSYFRALDDHSLKNMILLALSAIIAAYSQYGCVFVVIPVLFLFFVKVLMSKDKKAIVNIIIVYLAALILFAVPLYVFFAKIQLERHNIGHVALPVGYDIGKFFMKLGGLFYYSVFSRTVPENTAIMILGIFLFGITLFLLIYSIVKKNSYWFSISFITLFAYVLHFFLTEYHIYAMVHPELSAGYYCRYSIFYLCLFPILIPMIIEALFSSKKEIALLVILLGISVFSVPAILRNWEKSNDREVAAYWAAHHSDAYPTYLYGVAENAYQYFIGYDVQHNIVNHSWYQIYLDEVPDTFYLWFGDYGLDQAVSFREMYEELDAWLLESGYQADRLCDYEYGKLILYSKAS